jgi:archaeosine synthase beta-subunit
MMESRDTIAKAILRESELAGKTYAFDDSHDARVPRQTWFQESDEGTILFIVFYSQACRWSRCMGCSLPSQMSSRHVSYRDLMVQVDHIFADPEIMARREAVRKVIVSNNGSVLDEETFSSTALMYLLARLNSNMPNMSVLSLESRPEYVDLAELEFIARALAEGETPATLEIAIGFEVFDDRIRNEVFQKGLTLDIFEGLVERMASYGFRLKCYFMQKPVPGMTDEAAVSDIQCAIDYLSDVGARYGLAINMHLNPTFVAGGTPLENAFSKDDYEPPRLSDVARAAIHARGKGLSLFVGLSDEGLAVPGGTFIREGDAVLVDALEAFNRTQDYAILERLLAD